MGSAMETIYTFFLNYEQYIILLTICFFAGSAWRHHRLISRWFIIAASCLWVIYVYRYQIAVGWPLVRVVSYRSASFSPTALSYGTGLLYSLPQLLAEYWALHFDDTRPNQATARYGLGTPVEEPQALACSVGLSRPASGGREAQTGCGR